MTTTIADESQSLVTGPLLDERNQPRPLIDNVTPPIQLVPKMNQEAEERGKRLNKQIGGKSAERTALLGILLAELDGVDFQDVAALLGIKVTRLEQMMHGERQVPGHRESLWTELVELLSNLHQVVEPRATSRWLSTNIEQLDGRTPEDLIRRGQSRRVLELTKSYLDASFS